MKNSPSIEHTSAEELLAVVHSQLFTMSDAVICADALQVVTYIKHLIDKAERKGDIIGARIFKDILEKANG